jgi:hypothetical protein
VPLSQAEGQLSGQAYAEEGQLRDYERHMATAGRAYEEQLQLRHLERIGAQAQQQQQQPQPQQQQPQRAGRALQRRFSMQSAPAAAPAAALSDDWCKHTDPATNRDYYRR